MKAAAPGGEGRSRRAAEPAPRARRVGPPPPPEPAYLPHEVAVAIFVALAVQGGAAFAFHAAALDRPAAMPEIDKGASVPVKVVPVLDLESPLLKLGGKKQQYKLPDQWVRQEVVQRVEQKAFVSPKAGKTERDIPKPEVKVADAGTEPPPPDAAVAKQVDVPVTEPVDAGEPANVETEGHADGVKEGTETDPLKARVVDLYLARIAGWFTGRFRVSGSGLSPDEITKYRVAAVVQLSGGRIASYTITPSGNATFDAAARSTLEAAKGASLPPPPENYPDLGDRSIQVIFVCKPDRCD